MEPNEAQLSTPKSICIKEVKAIGRLDTRHMNKKEKKGKTYLHKKNLIII
jgi:hypothetical protein